MLFRSERVLVDVVLLVRRGEHLGLVNVVDTDVLDDLERGGNGGARGRRGRRGEKSQIRALAEGGGPTRPRVIESQLIESRFESVTYEDGREMTYLSLDKVTDSDLCHDGDGDGGHDLLDHLGVRHSGHSSLLSDVGGHSLESHDSARSSLLGDTGLLDVDDVDDDTSLELKSETRVWGKDVSSKSARADGRRVTKSRWAR